MQTYLETVKELLKWQQDCKTFEVSLEPPRDWCRLGAEDLTQDGLNKHFDTSEEDAKLVLAAKLALEQGVPAQLAFKIAMLDYIHGVHKCMVARHKPRLRYYLDDAAAKQYHNRKATAVGLGKLLAVADKVNATNAS